MVLMMAAAQPSAASWLPACNDMYLCATAKELFVKEVAPTLRRRLSLLCYWCAQSTRFVCKAVLTHSVLAGGADPRP